MKNLFNFIKKNKAPVNINDAWITREVKKIDVVIDCGANIGQETIPLMATGAIIHAFEPNPFAYKILKSKTRENRNVFCYNKGVYIKNDIMKLYLHENSDDDEVKWSTGSSMVQEKKNVLKNKYVEVEIIDLIEFIRNLNTNIKLLKIDVEGVEYDILDRLIESELLDKINLVLVEKDRQLREKISRLNITNINLNWI